MGALGYLFSFNGRTGRLGWWLRSAIIAPALMILALVPVVGAVQFSHLSQSAIEHLGYLAATSQYAVLMETAPPAVANAIWFLLGVYGLLAWINIAGCVKRYHDRGKTGAWCLIYLVPLIGPLWIFIECGFMSGDDGPNAYDIDTGVRQARAFSRANAALEAATSSPSDPPASGWGWQKEAVMDNPAPASDTGWKNAETSTPAPARPLKNNAAPWPSAPSRRLVSPAFGAPAGRSSFGLKKS